MIAGPRRRRRARPGQAADQPRLRGPEPLRALHRAREPALLRRRSTACRAARVDELLALVGLTRGRRSARSKTYSTGMKQRLLIARVADQLSRASSSSTSRRAGSTPPRPATLRDLVAELSARRDDDLPDHPLHGGGRRALRPRRLPQPGQDRRARHAARAEAALRPAHRDRAAARPHRGDHPARRPAGRRDSSRPGCAPIRC